MRSRIAFNAINNTVARQGDVARCILHADCGSQGGFNWSSQHLEGVEVFLDSDGGMGRPTEPLGSSQADELHSLGVLSLGGPIHASSRVCPES